MKTLRKLLCHKYLQSQEIYLAIEIVHKGMVK